VGACLEGLTLAVGSSVETFAAIATATFPLDLGAVGGAINSDFDSGSDTDFDSLIAGEVASRGNAVSEINSILGAGIVSDCSSSETEGRLGGLTNEEAGGMGKEWLVTAVLAEGAELGSTTSLGELRMVVTSTTLAEGGGELSRIVGLATARICCLAVRDSDSLVLATVGAFFAKVLDSVALG